MQESKVNKLKIILEWLSRHRKLVIVTVVCIVLTIILALVGIVLLKPAPKPVEPNIAIEVSQTPVEIPKPKFYSPLSGLEVNDEASTKSLVTAIMLENSPEARPQSGLKESSVIFEAIAEGGITRFLALYQQEKPQLIGPVRSLRMCFVDWLAAFNPSVAHIGGSAASLNEIRNGTYRDIDQFFNSQYYWRSNDRYSPHNVYTSFEKLDALNQSKGYSQSTFQGFPRVDSTALPTPLATKINVNISYDLFNANYQYDQTTNTYNRFQSGEPHLDREKGQISPRVVAIIKVPMKLTFEDGYRQNYQTIGSNQAFIFQDGNTIEGTWNKTSKASQIQFNDKNGNQINLARGQTWISAIPAETGGVTWQ